MSKSRTSAGSHLPLSLNTENATLGAVMAGRTKKRAASLDHARYRFQFIARKDESAGANKTQTIESADGKGRCYPLNSTVSRVAVVRQPGLVQVDAVRKLVNPACDIEFQDEHRVFVGDAFAGLFDRIVGVD